MTVRSGRAAVQAAGAASGSHRFWQILASLVSIAASGVSMPTTVCAGESGATNSEILRSFAPAKPVNFREPERSYAMTNLNGWTLQLEQELLDRQPVLAQRAANRLAAKLAGVMDLLPRRAHGVLRRLPVFLLLGEESVHGGHDNGAEYFQRQAPDHWPLLDRRWRSALVVYSAPNYDQLSEQWATRVLVHELAHAWQLEQWPEKQPDILGAWEQAVQKGLYLKVKAANGSVIERAYAMENQLEYFAELSMAYFWRGEYEPLDRAALRERDPAGFAMIEKMWGIHGPPPP
ncbi:MAG: hypothetical protein ABSC03_04695 [Verrucomicrobiota bacterium]